MPSADFWRFLPTPFNAGSTMANRQISPGIAHSPSRLCLSDLRRSVPCKNRASHLLALLTPLLRLYPLPVRQASVLPSASSGFPLARDTLAVRLTLPLAGCVEDFHLQVSAPCRAHQEKRSGRFAGPSVTEKIAYLVSLPGEAVNSLGLATGRAARLTSDGAPAAAP